MELFDVFQKVFGISVRKKQRDDRIKTLVSGNDDLREKNLKLTFEISKLKKDMGKVWRYYLHSYMPY